MLGAVLSIGIKVLVLIILAVKTIELFWMTSPGVQVVTREIFKEEVEEAGKVYFGKHKMHIGFAIKNRSIYDPNIGPYGEVVELPTDPLKDEEIAFSGMKNKTDGETLFEIPLISCEGLFSDVDDPNDE